MTESEIISNLKVLIATPQWQFFKTIIEDNDLVMLKKDLTTALKEAVKGNREISFEIVKNLQYRINVLEETLSLPERMIESYAPPAEQEKIDPYYQSKHEIDDDNKLNTP